MFRFRKFSFQFTFIVALAFSPFELLLAQGAVSSPYVPNVVPPSPNAAALMKFTDVPVSTYTGTADISVPLYTIQARGITVPISLSYHTGGIRLKEESGWVGLGWALNAGGMVSRTIMGHDDLATSGSTYLTNTIPQFQGDLSFSQPAQGPIGSQYKNFFDFFCAYLVNFNSGTADYAAAFSGGVDTYDMEPDIFSYNFPGHSGKFILTRTGNVVMQKQENIKIRFQGRDSTVVFTITDDQGNTYFFNVLEKTAIAIKPVQISSWLLSKIITQQKDSIVFNYANGGATSSEAPDYSQSAGFYCQSITGTTTTNANNPIYFNQTLQSIDFSNGHIQFAFDSLRADLYAGNKLDSVMIYTRNSSGTLNYLKQENFYFSYFNSSYNNPSLDPGEYCRLKLDSVKEKSGSLSVPPYSFTYYNPNPGVGSKKHSYNVDHWGYYNGSDNQSLIPSINLTYQPTDGNVIGVPQTLSFQGGDRQPHFDYMQDFSLQQVTYPTGGKTVLTYQPNDYDYSNSIIGPTDGFTYVQLVPMDSLITFDHRTGTLSGTIDLTHITPIIPPLTSGTNVTINVAFRYQQNDGTRYQQSGKIYFTLGGTTWDIHSATCIQHQPVCTMSSTLNFTPGVYSWSAYVDSVAIDINTVFAGIYVEVLYQETQQVNNQLQNNSYILPAGGLRIQNITNYKDASTIASKKTFSYTYSQDKLGTGQPQQYSYGRLMSLPSYARYVTTEDYVGIEECTGLYLFSSSLTSLTSAIQGNIVGYDQITEYNVDPQTGQDIGKTVYKYYNTADSVLDYIGYRIPGLFNIGNNLNGQLLSKVNYSNSNGLYSKVDETDFNYHTTNRIVYWSPKYQYFTHNTITGTPDCPNPVLRTVAWFYPSIKSEKILQDSTTEYLFDQFDMTKSLITKKYSYYDNPVHYQLTRTGSIDSKGNTFISQLKYPQDYIPKDSTWSKNTILDSLIGRNMVAGVIEKKDSLIYAGTMTGRVTGAQLTKYKFLTGGSMGLDKQYRLDLAGPISNFQPFSINLNTTSQDSRYRQMISFDSYDNSNNIAQYTPVDQTPVSLLWDYNKMYPTAQVKNSILNDIAYSSFEADGNGNWNVTSSTRDTINYITGRKSYNLSNGSISKTGLVSGKVYMVTYWSKNGSYSIAGGTGTVKTGRSVSPWTYYEHTITASSTTFTITGSGNVDELRLYPQGTQMTSYSYAPLVGVTAMNDPNSEITYYEYDSLTRLKNIKDYQGNIIRNYQYNYGQACTSCVLTMKTLAQTATLSYPVGVFSVANKLLGNATTQTQYVTLWNADATNHAIGTLTAGADSMHFILNVTSGQTSPGYVIGCRYYQVDLPWNKMDAVRNINGCFVDFGDGTSMRLGKTNIDTIGLILPINTTMNFAPAVGDPSTGNNRYFIGYGPYYTHNYPDTSLKTLTFYHNDGTETPDFDSYTYPANSLFRIKNYRGYFPQNMQFFGGTSIQMATANSVANIVNWNYINSIVTWYPYGGYYAVILDPCRHITYAQDFMKNNRNLNIIYTANGSYYTQGYSDTTFKISRLKSDWTTYFTNLQAIAICEDQWNHENLSAISQLNYFNIIAANQNHSNFSAGNPIIPIPTTEIDNIINQIAAGSGQHISNGTIVIQSGGPVYSSASAASVTFLKSEGWSIVINSVYQ